MRFEIISHACMLIEHQGHRLLTDPWLSGSAYWRSWWHFPEASPVTEELLGVDYIYLTHQHFDHFHYPSLRRFNKKTKVFVPAFPVGNMAEAAKSLGFEEVIAMPHGKPFELPGGLTITSYQAGWMDDSALVASAGGVTLLNLNDTKMQERQLDQIVQRHGPITFVFRSHSSAQAYPDCYRSSRPEDLTMRKREDYVRDFENAAVRAGASWAIPFASNVCLLHPESKGCDGSALLPLELARAYAPKVENPPGLEVMLPGASWDREHGFSLVSVAPFENAAVELARLEKKHQSKIEEQDQLEKKIELTFASFQAYFEKFLAALPLAARAVFGKRTLAYQPNDREEWWVLDVARSKVTRELRKPDSALSVTRVSPGLLQDAIDKSIVNFLDISKRLRIDLEPGNTLRHFVFRELLQMYEQGYFPLRDRLNKRFFETWYARRIELFAIGEKVLTQGGRAFIPAVGVQKG